MLFPNLPHFKLEHIFPSLPESSSIFLYNA